MPRSLGPIPTGVQIVDKAGAINDFFRLRWQQLIDAFTSTPATGALQKLALTAALVTTAIYTTKSAGVYRISYYMRKTAADGVSSSLTFTFGWSESGIAQTESETALTTDAVTAQQSGSKVVWADAVTDLTAAIAYASNTPGAMSYRVDAVVEQLI